MSTCSCESKGRQIFVSNTIAFRYDTNAQHLPCRYVWWFDKAMGGWRRAGWPGPKHATLVHPRTQCRLMGGRAPSYSRLILWFSINVYLHSICEAISRSLFSKPFFVTPLRNKASSCCKVEDPHTHSTVCWWEWQTIKRLPLLHRKPMGPV